MAPPRLFAVRAGAVASAGAVMLLIAFVFDAAPLFVSAVALILVGLSTPAWVWISARGAIARRDLRADRVVEGDPLTATIVVRRGPLGLPGRRSSWIRPRVHGWRCRGRLRRFGAAVRRACAWSFASRAEACTRSSRRSCTSRDPLDLARVEATSAESDQTLLVLPRTEPVRWRNSGRGRRLDHLDGDHAAEMLAAVDLDGLRPYRPGTPASRIHWPAVARGAGLIERRSAGRRRHPSPGRPRRPWQRRG